MASGVKAIIPTAMGRATDPHAGYESIQDSDRSVYTSSVRLEDIANAMMAVRKYCLMAKLCLY